MFFSLEKQNMRLTGLEMQLLYLSYPNIDLHVEIITLIVVFKVHFKYFLYSCSSVIAPSNFLF